jgi:predicted metal-dependent peptidase
MDSDLLEAVLDAINKVVNTDQYGMFRYFLGTISIAETKSAVAATDGRKLYVGKDFLKYSPGERAAIIIHELWHMIGGDAFRGVDKDHELWNIVTDIINNDTIDKQHLGDIVLPKDVLREPKIAGMIKEQAYDYLIDLCKKQGYFEIMGIRFNCIDAGKALGNMRDIIPNDNIEDEQATQRRLEESEKQYEQSTGHGSWLRDFIGKNVEASLRFNYKDLGEALGDMKDLIPNDNVADQQETRRRLEESERQYEQLTGHSSWLRDYLGRDAQAKLPWQTIVQQYLKKLAAVDYTWTPPKQIYGVTKEPLTLPRLYTKSLKLAIAVDTSRGIGNDELSMFLAEMKRLISVIWFNLSFSGVLMLTTDDVYYSQPIPPIPTKVSVIEKLENGGTDFRPAFNLIKEKYHDNIDLFIYFTDGYGHYPETPPRYPVLWILITSPNKLKEAGYYPPYGMAIPL